MAAQPTNKDDASIITRIIRPPAWRAPSNPSADYTPNGARRHAAVDLANRLTNRAEDEVTSSPLKVRGPQV